jgi:hypothetical protein
VIAAPIKPGIDALQVPCDLHLTLGDDLSTTEVHAGDWLVVVFGRLQVYPDAEFRATFRTAAIKPGPAPMPPLTTVTGDGGPLVPATSAIPQPTPPGATPTA